MANNLHPKCILLEFLSKNKIITKPIVTMSDKFIKKMNTHEFICKVELDLNGRMIVNFSQCHKTKKDAEREAFQLLLENVLMKKDNSSLLASFDHVEISEQGNFDQISMKHVDDDIPNKITNHPFIFEKISFPFGVLVIVDFDNVSKKSEMDKLMELKTRVDTNFDIYKICSFLSSNKKDADFVVRSSRKDAVDHYISCYIGHYFGTHPLNNTKIFVMSRDNFGGCHRDFNFGWVEHVPDVDDLIHILKNMKK
jgi:hypothetical protein